jgi:D-alanine-D-alanine ligase
MTFNDCIILFGGSSEERMVSVASGQNLASKIPEAKLWFWGQDGSVTKVSHEELEKHEKPFTHQFKPGSAATFSSMTEALPDLKNKFVILALHGTEGEDGTLQKFFETQNVAFSGSGSTASGLAFDKFLTKELAKKFGIPVAEDLVLKDFSSSNLAKLDAFYKTHKKIVLKPLANGSSVGLFIIHNEVQLLDAINKIKTGTLHYIAEPFLEGREITVGVWEKKKGEVISLPCSEVRVIKGRHFDYEGKYLGSGVEEITPAEISPDETKQCQDIALKIHQLVGCKGYSRTDIILTDKGPFMLEINTLPGLSKASFVPQQLAAMHVLLRDFFEAQISL